MSSISKISQVQCLVFTIYWIATIALLWSSFKSTNNLYWLCFSIISVYLIIFLLIALLHNRFVKDERNFDNFCLKETPAPNDFQLETNLPSSSTAEIVIEKRFYQKVGQQQEPWNDFFLYLFIEFKNILENWNSFFFFFVNFIALSVKIEFYWFLSFDCKV